MRSPRGDSRNGGNFFEGAAASAPRAREIRNVSCGLAAERVRVVTVAVREDATRVAGRLPQDGDPEAPLMLRSSWSTKCRADLFAARLVLKTKHLGMPNVLAGREIVPELIQHEARPGAIAKAVLRLTNDQTVRAEMISEFDAVIERLGETGASAQAARAILDELNWK